MCVFICVFKYIQYISRLDFNMILRHKSKSAVMADIITAKCHVAKMNVDQMVS